MTRLTLKTSRRESPPTGRGRVLLGLLGLLLAAAAVSAGIAVAMGTWVSANMDTMADQVDHALGVDETHRTFVDHVVRDLTSLTDGEPITTNGLRRDFQGRIAANVSVPLATTPSSQRMDEIGRLMCTTGADADVMSIDLHFTMTSEKGSVGVRCDDARLGTPVAELATATLEMPVDRMLATISVDAATSTAEIYGQVWLGANGSGANVVGGVQSLAKDRGFASQMVVNR